MKRHLPFLLLLLVFGFLYFRTTSSHGGFVWDEAEYALLARNLARGESYESGFRPPLVPLTVAAVIKGSGETREAVLKTPIVLFALLGLTLVYGFVSKHFDNTTGLAAAGFLGLAPSLWLHTSYLLTEVPFLVLFCGSCFCFVEGLYGDEKWFFGAWLFTGLAFITRYTCVLLGPIFVLFLILGAFLDRPTVTAKLKSKTFWLAPFVGLLVQLPWLIRQQAKYGDFLKGFKYASGQLQAYIPGLEIPAYFYLVELPSMLTWPGLIFALAGLVWSLRQRNKFGLHATVVIIFLLVWFSAYRYKETRLITAILPFLGVAAGLGYGQLLPKVWKGFGNRWLAFLSIIAMTVLSMMQTIPIFKTNRSLGYPSLKNTVQGTQKYLGPGTVLMSAPQPQTRWYSDRKTVGFPPNEEDFLAELDKVHFVMVVNYERGQPEYAARLVSQLFPEPPSESQKYLLFIDSLGQATFFTSAEEFKQRLRNSKS